jgi:hypothetical protein
MHRVELSLAQPTPPQVLYWYKSTCCTGTGTKVLAVLVQSTNTDSGSAQQPRRGDVEMARSSCGGVVCGGDVMLLQELQISWNDGDSEDTLKRLGEVRLTL